MSTFDGGLQVTHATLEQAANDMQQTVRNIDARMDRLESELEPLRSQWAGAQQDAYTIAKAKWDAAILEMRTLLDDAHRQVHTANQSYADADRRGAARFE